jgi:hypothetical protein
MATEIAKREAFEMIRATDPTRYQILENPLRLIDLELRNDPYPSQEQSGKTPQEAKGQRETKDQKIQRVHKEMEI